MPALSVTKPAADGPRKGKHPRGQTFMRTCAAPELELWAQNGPWGRQSPSARLSWGACSETRPPLASLKLVPPGRGAQSPELWRLHCVPGPESKA